MEERKKEERKERKLKVTKDKKKGEVQQKKETINTKKKKKINRLNIAEQKRKNTEFPAEDLQRNLEPHDTS